MKASDYKNALVFVQSQLETAFEYHEQLQEFQKNYNEMEKEIEKNIEEQEIKEKLNQTVDQPEDCIRLQLDDVLNDVTDVNKKYEEKNLTEMISKLNPDQKRIFDNVTSTILSGGNPVRLFISEEGGSGKNFLIETLRCQYKF